jgi:hypothetical protein
MEIKNQGIQQVGKMHGWHRNITYLGVVLTVISGIVFFIAHDLMEMPKKDIRMWVSLHGVVGHLFLLVLGMALYHHVQVNWRMKKNRSMGSLMVLSIVFLMGTILAMYYGRGVVHEAAEILHLFAGSLLGIVFFLHIQIGKKAFSTTNLHLTQNQAI